jgi:hypothetical protein
MMTMMTFAISLLFTAGAAFAVLVVVGMLVGNRHVVRAALLGQGSMAVLHPRGGAMPPLLRGQVRVFPVQRGRGQIRRAEATVTPLRAAA